MDFSLWYSYLLLWWSNKPLVLAFLPTKIINLYFDRFFNGFPSRGWVHLEAVPIFIYREYICVWQEVLSLVFLCVCDIVCDDDSVNDEAALAADPPRGGGGRKVVGSTYCLWLRQVDMLWCICIYTYTIYVYIYNVCVTVRQNFSPWLKQGIFLMSIESG